MKLPVTRSGLGIVCALALSVGPLASPAHAGLIPWAYNSIFGTGGYGYGGGYNSFYGPYSGYGYSGYTASYSGYGGYGYGGGCCLSGLFGYGQSSYVGYTPNYYSPSYAPCGNSCGSCGSCNSCGSTTYGAGGVCCNNGCASGDCGISNSSSGSVSPAPYSGEPVPNTSQPASPSNPPQTYREPASGAGGFTKPQPIPGKGNDSGGLLLPGSDSTTGSSSGGSSSGVTPSGGTQPDNEIQRGDGIQFDAFKIQPRDKPETEPADEASEPEAEEKTPDESRIIEPLHVDAQVAYRVQPQLRRAHYRALFRAPSVARIHVPDNSGWESLDAQTQLANSLVGER